MSASFANYPYGPPAAECGCERGDMDIAGGPENGGYWGAGGPKAAWEDCPDDACESCCEDTHHHDGCPCHACVADVKADRAYESFRDGGDDD